MKFLSDSIIINYNNHNTINYVLIEQVFTERAAASQDVQPSDLLQTTFNKETAETFREWKFLDIEKAPRFRAVPERPASEIAVDNRAQ